jgi:hypothetical protein
MLWIVRVAWAVLPVTAGTSIADATASWSSGPRAVAAALLWLLWAIGLLAAFIPRPISVATLRTFAPIAFALAAVSATSTSTADAITGVAVTALAWFGVATPAFARAGVNALAYGDEDRYPLKTPPALFLGPLPLAVALFAAGVSSGPLLLADARWLIGAVAVVVGFPLAFVLARSFIGLTRRMAVLVPAGIVIVDPMTLGDPYLFTQDHIARLRTVESGERADDMTLDTRAGAFVGALGLEFREPADVLRVRPGRRGGAMSKISNIWFSPVQAHRFTTQAEARRSRRVQ